MVVQIVCDGVSPTSIDSGKSWTATVDYQLSNSASQNAQITVRCKVKNKDTGSVKTFGNSKTHFVAGFGAGSFTDSFSMGALNGDRYSVIVEVTNVDYFSGF